MQFLTENLSRQGAKGKGAAKQGRLTVECQ